jgi:hypothetical protein
LGMQLDMGKAFPCDRAEVSANPFCGETLQRPRE